MRDVNDVRKMIDSVLLSGDTLGWGNLDQRASELLRMPKDVCDGIYSRKWPAPGEKLAIELFSEADKTVKFFLDISESKRSTSIAVGIHVDRKTTMQSRESEKKLLRIDYASNPDVLRHMNPDLSIVQGSHIHLDIDGNGDKWAFPFDQQSIVSVSNPPTVASLYYAFQDVCSVTRSLVIEQSLGV